MNKLEQEAEEKYPFHIYNGCEQSAFIAGATSKYIEREKIKILIEENESVLQMLELHGNERLTIPVINRIKELEKQLNELI